MDEFACYLPLDRRLALSTGETLPTRAVGATLVADVSGFTPLTAAYERAFGPRQGPEELIGQINLVYDALITTAHEYGGSVIYFSGDAITCWFDGDDGLRAVACGLIMQQRMRAFAAVETPGHEVVTLGIKIAIAAGPVRRFAPGDPAIRRIDVLVGSTLDRMATAETVAHAGEIIVSAELLQHDPGRFSVQEWRTLPDGDARFAVIAGLTQAVAPAPWPAEAVASTLDDALARPWLIADVYERIKAGTVHYLAEFRPAVALFLRFSGLDYDNDEQVGEKLDAYIRWVQRIVTRYAGNLLQLTTGDKGSYLYAAFGAPVAHEDDADRALLAAQALRHVPAELSFIRSNQIGISRGQMRVGPYGSRRRRVYGAFGHETNMAARLMTVAGSGEVVVSQRVLDAIARRERFAFDALGLVSVKGSAEPIAAFKLREPDDATAVSRVVTQFQEPASGRHTLVGRLQERRQLTDLLDEVSTGISRVVVIEGEAGIGKSHIVRDFVAEARAAGVVPLLGEANAIEQASPYFAWRVIFHMLFQLDAAPPALWERQEYVLAQLPAGDELRQLAPLLNAVIALDLPESDLTREMSGLARANKTHELLTAVLRDKATHTPLLIVLEDAHWMDSASWALAEAVQQSVHPLLFVLVTRPLERQELRVRAAVPEEGGETTPQSALLTHAATRHIRLRPLPVDDALTLVSRRLGVNALPKPIAGFIAERAEGHPFFSEELAYALREANVIEVVDGVCRLTIDPAAVRELDFPTTIEGVITSRIDRLEPAQQLTLKVSSVIGRIFAIALLNDIHPVQEDRPYLPGHLRDLNRLDIMLLETPEPDLAYMFKHIITQQVAYNRLLYAQRRDLHRKVAAWYESRAADALESMAPLLAYHWYQALDMNHLDSQRAAKAIDYAELAGDQAIRKYANQEAVRFFSAAQTIAARLHNAAVVPDQRLAHWALQLGEAYLGLGQLVEAREHFEHCLQLFGWPVAPSDGRMTAGLLKEFAVRALPQRVRGTTAVERQSLREAARAYELLGQVYYLSNQSLPTLYAMLRGLNLAERVGQGTPELARAYANMSGAVALVPLHRQSRNFEARAWETAGEINHLTTLAYVAFITSVHKINLAAWDEGNRGFQQGLELANQLGDRRTAGFCISGMAHIAFYQGFFDRSLALFEQLAQLGESAQDVTHWSTGLGGQAAIMLHYGQWQAALDCTERAVPLSLEAGNLLAEWNSRVRQGLAQFRLGQLAEARQSVDDSFDYIKQAPHTSFANTTVYSDFIFLLLLLWEQSPQTAADLKPKAAALLQRYRQYTRVFPFALPSYWRLRGWQEWLNGRYARAFKAWDRALAEAARKQMPVEAGMAHYQIGRHLPAADPARAEHLAQAARILAALGARFEADQAQAALQTPAA